MTAPPTEKSALMHIYLVNVDFPPVSGPGIWRILAFAKYAAQAGHQVTVFCSDRSSWHDWQDPKLLQALPATVRVIRIPSYFLRDLTDWIARRRQRAGSEFARNLYKNLWWRTQRYWPDPVAHWAMKCARLAVRMARSDKPDCIFTTGPQHLAHVAGHVLRQRLNIPWIMDYRDPWTDTPDLSQADEARYQKRLAVRMELKFLKEADLVTVVSPSWLEMLADKTGGRREKFVLLRNGHDLQLTDLPSCPPRGERASCRIHFNGTIQPASNVLSDLHQALNALVQQGFTSSTLQISFCGLPPAFVESLRPSPVRDFILDLGPLSHEESLRQCLNADALMVIVRDQGAVQRGVIPGKTYEAMALGKHVLGILPPQCDTRALLEAYGNVTLSNGTSPPDIASALRQLLDTFASSQRTLPAYEGARRAAMATQYARSSQADDLMMLMRDLAARRRNV